MAGAIPAHKLVALLTGLLVATASAAAQTTWYVDDDAPNDPAPGDPSISDPLEDGSQGHPFDAIQEGIDAALDGDTVLVLDGTYTGAGNRDLDFAGRLITVRSENGPATCIVDCNYSGRGFYFHNGETADSVVDGFTITNGEVDGGGGGVACHENSSPTLMNCEIVGNRAGSSGGVHCNESSPTIINCAILENRATSTYGSAGGLGCHEFSHPTIVDCVIAANNAHSGGGIYCNSHSHPTFLRCAVASNHAVDSAGGVRCYYGSSPHFINCTIIGNSVTRHTGGGVSSSEGDPAFTNCVIAANTARDEGGGVWCYRGDLTFTNCTITGNRVVGFDTLGGGVYCQTESTLTFTNCILWANSAVEGAEVALADVSTIAISYSDVCGGLGAVYLDDPYVCTLLWGDGNIDAEPLFAAAEDYHLLPESPCINAGTNYVSDLPDEDIDGAPRLQWCRVDMGAYESPNGPAVFSDCNENGELDDCDVYGGVSADDNRNNIPDECEVPVVWHVDAEAAPGGDGSAEHPFDRIQEGIDAGHHGDTVLVADGTYTGLGNKELDFLGKAITVCSESGPDNCVIDCENDGRAFWIRRNEGPDSIVDGFTITNGYVYAHGGGAHCQGSSPLIVNCRFWGNTADDTGEVQGGRGGGLCCRRNSSPTIRDCTFIGNTAKYEGAGISVRGSGSPTIIGCIITANRIVVGSDVGSGGGVDAWYCTLTIVNCSITENESGYAGGGLSSLYNSAIIANCVISGNTTDRRGAGVYCYESSPTIIGCVVSENTAGGVAGGLYFNDCSPIVANCIIAGNHAATRGGGVYCVDGNPAIVNSTIVENTTPLQGGGFYFFQSDATINNSILWADNAAEGREITLYEATLRVSYSDAAGGQPAVYDASGDSTLHWGTGNIDADPLFIDPDGPDDDPNTFEDNDYHLSAGSPCIDAADNEAVPADALDLDGDGDTDEPIPFDLDGNPRFVDDPDTDDTGNGTPPIVDMGAYEFQISVAAYLDIKPGSCPNPLNRRSHGVLPVAIVGTADFDATQIDVDTLVLMRADGVGGSVTPLMGPPGPGIRVEDVATPFEGEPCECHELGGDGIDDLSMKFDTEAVVAELQLNGLPGGTMVELVVSGALSDGTPFNASDCIRLVPPDSGGGPDGSAVGDDAREGVPTRRQAMPPQDRSADDSSRQRTDGAERARSGASESDDAERSEESQDASGVPLAACGPVSPALLLTTLAGMGLLRCRRP